MDKETYKPSAIGIEISQEIERVEKERSFHLQIK
jgi:hypothetical protein